MLPKLVKASYSSLWGCSTMTEHFLELSQREKKREVIDNSQTGLAEYKFF
jgi:hypothetical protein